MLADSWLDTLRYMKQEAALSTEYQLYEVWSEGYAATGQRGTAQFLGSAVAASFKDACHIIVRRYPDLYSTYNKQTNSVWACRLFPSGTQARESFG